MVAALLAAVNATSGLGRTALPSRRDGSEEPSYPAGASTAAFQLAGQRLDAVAALIAGGGVTLRVDFARLQIIEHHGFGGHELRAGMGHRGGQFVGNARN